MKKNTLLAALVLAGLLKVQAQNLVLHYALDDLTATVGPSGNLIPNGSGTAANTDSLGATNTVGEHCASFFHGAGYVSTSALNNNGWSGTALSYWYKSQSTYQGVIVQGAYLGFGSRMYTNGHVEATFDGSAAGSISSTVAINDGVWHHVVVQNNGTTTQIYIDGVLNNTGAEPLYTLSGSNSDAKIYLGSHINDNPNEKIDGKVDEIKVFDNVLSQTQIDALYAYAPTITTNLDKFNSQNIVNLFPNPTNAFLNLEAKENNTIQIINVLGETVASQTINTGNNNLDVSALKNGVYFIHSSNGGTVKFIKE